MKLTVSNYAELLDEVTPPDAKGKVIPERIVKFLALVRKNRAWSQLPRIISAYETRVFKRQGIVRVTVRTPKPLTVSEEKKIAEQLGRDLKSIIWNTEVDPTLVGGLQLQIDDRVVRGSIRDHLQSLSKQLSS